MTAVKITFENKETITTRINGTIEGIKKYYLGKYFNLGKEKDDMQKAIKCEFLKNN